MIVIRLLGGLFLLVIAAVGFLSAGAGGGWFAASDNPDNPPLLGNWTVDTRVTSIGVNNMNYSRDGFAANGGEDLLDSIESSETKACFEPAIKDDSDVVDSAEERFGDCDLVESSGDAANRHAALTCEKGRQSLDVTIDGSMDQSAGRATFSVRQSETKDSGATETMTLRVNQSWTRTGDCA